MAIKAGQIIRAADFAPTAWQPVVFDNGWQNLGSGYYDVEFRYLPATGHLELRGAMMGGTLTSGTTAFHLPEGYRPSANCAAAVGVLASGWGAPRIVMWPNGEVSVHGADSSNGGQCSLVGIHVYIG